jgi:hypothetical protein
VTRERRRRILGIMSTESGATDTEAVQRAFDDACSFFEDDDIAKARRVVTAGNILLRRHATFAGSGGVTMSFNPEYVKSRIDFALEFIAATANVEDGGIGVIYHSVEAYR